MKQQGFTLIELMIVIAILGILAAIAIPTYQDYMIRARVSEGVAVASAAKVGVAEYRQAALQWPTNNTLAGVSDVQTSFVTSLAVSGAGLITIDINETSALGGVGIDDGTTLNLVLTPSNVTGAVVWTCTATGSGVNAKYAPASCR